MAIQVLNSFWQVLDPWLVANASTCYSNDGSIIELDTVAKNSIQMAQKLTFVYRGVHWNQLIMTAL